MTKSEAYEFGVVRGMKTRRSEPIDADWDWIAAQTDGRVQTGPEADRFAAGMRAGAAEARHHEPSRRP